MLILIRKCEQAVRLGSEIRVSVTEVGPYAATIEIRFKSEKHVEEVHKRWSRKIIANHNLEDWQVVVFSLAHKDCIAFDETFIQIMELRHNDVEPKIQIGFQTDLTVYREEVFFETTKD